MVPRLQNYATNMMKTKMSRQRVVTLADFAHFYKRTEISHTHTHIYKRKPAEITSMYGSRGGSRWCASLSSKLSLHPFHDRPAC